MLATGAERIYSFGQPWDWDGRWLVVILRVPEERREVRHVLRTRLAWAGLGSLGGGVWLTPHVEREAELASVIAEEPAAEATSFVASLGALGQPDELVAAAWDLEAVREHYDAFIEDFPRAPSLRRRGVFRMQTLLVHAWRKFPFLDPDLPAELLPSGWPRRRAHGCSRVGTHAGVTRLRLTSPSSSQPARRAPLGQPEARFRMPALPVEPAACGLG